MHKNILQEVILFFTPKSTFSPEEWILKYQIKAMLVFSFFFGIGVFFFSIFRFFEGNYIVALSQFIFSTFSLYGFIYLRKEKSLYPRYSIIFFILFFSYTGIIFFFVPENRLNILWVISAPILIFFFLNKQGGIAMFLLVFNFIIYLMLSQYPYSSAEFITLLASFFITTFIMYMYEKVKEQEKIRLQSYNTLLKKEVNKQTHQLQKLNETLQERVKEELEKQQAQEQMLLCQNRMANMGIMIDSIAHQWRQPLMHINSILMNISRVTETQPNNIEYIDNKVNDIFEITQHMSQTIGDFRELFSPEKEKKVFKIEVIIENILNLLKNNLKEIHVNVHLQNITEIKSYPNELSQVLLIILQNAIEAFKERSVVNKIINLSLYENEKYIYINIDDTAQGISPEALDNIFKPYFSTKKEHSGTGLGLYIAKIIMERSLKGKILATNQENGASFKLILPLK
jgi:signal transduction histidine kinase